MLATATKNEAKPKTDFFAEIIAAIDNAEHTTIEMSPLIGSGIQAEKDSFLEPRAVSQPFQPATSISQKLDAMIEASAAFDVSEDKFEIVGSDNLTEGQKQYLVDNEREVLCTLHQRLLLKHLFSHSPELLEEFAFDIYEREAILADGNGNYTYETYFEAVRVTSQKWFVRLIDSIDDFTF
jgi:hypothetical protein